jgi:YidC/Oxa1 family membrane protein insertase
MTAIPPAAAIVATSMFGQLIDALGRLLAFFYSLIPNYGISIIFLTIAVRLLLFPLTAKQVRSMKRMSQLQPEIKRLQAKYRDDRQKMNEELLRFYKENQINPAAGCLPLLLQMPVFFALFKVLRDPLDHIPISSDLFKAFCGDAAKAVCDPKGLKFMWMDLSVQAREGPEKLTGGNGFTSFTQALPYFILIVLVVLTGMYQAKMMQAKQPQDNPSPQAAQMQMIAKILPIFMGFISLGMPAGIVLYFLVGNLWQIGQQALISNRDVKLPPIKFVDRDDDVVEVEGAGVSGAQATLVADGTADDSPATTKPAPKAGNQRAGARKPAAGSGSRQPAKATNPTNAGRDAANKAAANKAAANRAAANKAAANKPATNPAATNKTVTNTTPAPEADEAPATSEAGGGDGAAARPAPRPMFPWRKTPETAAGNGRDAANGRESTGRATGGRGAAKGGSGTGSSGANRSGTPTSGRVTPKGGNARKPRKRR